jgi:hypothetical protein
MKHFTFLVLFSSLAACGTEYTPVQSELDYHVLSVYSLHLEQFLHDQDYSADGIANALKAHPIHYHEHSEGWTYILGNGQEADGRSYPQPDGSWHVECVPSAFTHEIAHYLMGTIGGVEDPTHLNQEWWGFYGVVNSMNDIAAETAVK